MMGKKKRKKGTKNLQEMLQEEDDGEIAAAAVADPGDWKLEWSGEGVTGGWRDDRGQRGGRQRLGSCREQRAEVRKWTMRRL